MDDVDVTVPVFRVARWLEYPPPDGAIHRALRVTGVAEEQWYGQQVRIWQAANSGVKASDQSPYPLPYWQAVTKVQDAAEQSATFGDQIRAARAIAEEQRSEAAGVPGEDPEEGSDSEKGEADG